MSKYTDGKKTVEIVMKDWEDCDFLPAWEADFFNNGCLEYDEENDTYKVQDVDYLIEQALDYKYSTGDFADAWDSPLEGTKDHQPEDRGVWVDDEYMEDVKLQTIWFERYKDVTGIREAEQNAWKYYSKQAYEALEKALKSTRERIREFEDNCQYKEYDEAVAIRDELKKAMEALQNVKELEDE